MVKQTDVLIIGAGPGGYPAAARAAQLGKTVVIVDKGSIGGECLNWGCIPSKALIHASSFYHKLQRDAKKMGIKVTDAQLDLKRTQKWKESVQRRLINGIKTLLKSNNVELLIGEAKLEDTNRASVQLNDGANVTIEFENAIIATGASFISLPGFEIDEENILSAKGVLELDSVPEELICIGGGIIGLELGTVYAKFGSKLKVVELLPQLMTGVDIDLVKVVQKKLRAMDVDIYLETTALNYEKSDGKLALQIQTKDGIKTITGDKILLSIGKRASTQNLGLDKVGVITDQRGFVITDNQQKTNINNIFAVGDCTGMPFLAHRATKQGLIAAEVIGGLDSKVDFSFLPSAIFTDPEIAFAGLSESEALKFGHQIHVSKAPFMASGRAMTQLETDGYVKMIANKEDGKILGIEIVGPHASDLISEGSLALEMGVNTEELGNTIHPHPTLPEMIMEASEAIEGKAIHVENITKND
ncbi:MAG: dihydrolipoyl dehydrogenase [Candidatus Kariarchaeaceae archaeon]